MKRYAQPPEFDWSRSLARRCKVADWHGWLARMRRDPWERGPRNTKRYRRRGRLLIAEGWRHYHREVKALRRQKHFWSRLHYGSGMPKAKPLTPS